MDKYQILKKYFGYSSFRKGQEELIDSILSGQDVLGIMPTGAGKSLCYQIPALLLPGISLVISPLISLMKDQVRALNEAGVHAAYINSSLTEGQISKALGNAKRGQYKIVYVAPERLGTAMFQDFIGNVEISMVTVDEAHCISQWGQDFRPSYLNIVAMIDSLVERPVVSAFTATATEEVKDDILCVLKLEQPNVLVNGFNRENLYFEVREPNRKPEEVLRLVSEHPNESGIIYCATRKNVERVYDMLCDQGISAGKYHAGMTNEERKQNQDEFIYDEKPVIVATNAFGMGIDKSNVRYVVHYNMPQSMENYYQEAGRAGRDGERAECILLYSPQDVMINQFLLDHKEIRTEAEETDIRVVQERDRKRLRRMSQYCATKDCLRQYILNYFGEYDTCACGNCSRCLGEYEEADVTETGKHMIQCVRETGQRFGMNVITGVLRGEKKAKLLSYGFDRLESYGLESGTGEKKLKQIMQEMIMQEYLQVTPDKYSIVRLGRNAASLQQTSARLLMKVSKADSVEEQREQRTRRGGGHKTSDVLTSRGLDLFELLRERRLQLAREEGMPPYIVCSDKTLVDMCVRVPFSREEMLQVNGIGENKYEKYGEAFTETIREFLGGKKEMLYYGEPQGGRTGTRGKKEK